MSQTLLSFEQATVDAERAAIAAEQAAKVAARTAMAEAREAKRRAKQAKTDEWRRKLTAARISRTPDEHAQCGINWYCRSPRDRDRGCYWTHCHKCGQPLIYTSDRNAKPQICAGRRTI